MKSYFIPVLALVLMACKKEAPLTASPVKKFYTLPQGNAPADKDILDIHGKFGTYILYRFSQDDYAYNYYNELKDSAFNANPAYIDTALGFFRHQLMDLYPEKFLRKTMPFKVLLAAYIGTGTARSATGFATTQSMLAIGWADSTLLQKTPAELRKIRSLMHRFYWERAYRTESFVLPPAFLATAPDYQKINVNNRYSEGIVADGYYSLNLNAGQDFVAYIELITGKTTAELEAGLFQPGIDTKGLIRKRYQIIVDYYKQEFGIDLQAIGQRP
ncbi:hypothetical protein [Chitinophaga caseinilytica]|uniref:Uncharacterized protein n=1 Tax=Chitinophaga caseinilytica TaxID=2267521 RepID=A0ABZ2ZF42_9BACT